MSKRDKKLIVVGDRILIAPEHGKERTKVGLYLPQTVVDKDSAQEGIVMATGPGIPLSAPQDVNDEPWKTSHDSQKIQYLPMEAKAGDHVIFLRKSAIEIRFDGKTYLIVPYNAILVILRENEDESISSGLD